MNNFMTNFNNRIPNQFTNFNNRIPNQFTNFNNQTRTPIFTTPLIRPPINTFLPQTRFNFTNLNRPTPIVRPTLENLRTNTTIELFIENENTDNELCTICRQNFENNDILRTINHCNHHFRILPENYVNLLLDEGTEIRHFHNLFSKDFLSFKGNKAYKIPSMNNKRPKAMMSSFINLFIVF